MPKGIPEPFAVAFAFEDDARLFLEALRSFKPTSGSKSTRVEEMIQWIDKLVTEAKALQEAKYAEKPKEEKSTGKKTKTVSIQQVHEPHTFEVEERDDGTDEVRSPDTGDNSNDKPKSKKVGRRGGKARPSTR